MLPVSGVILFATSTSCSISSPGQMGLDPLA